jgi:hypothetical protein
MPSDSRANAGSIERIFSLLLGLTAVFEGGRAGAGTFRLLLDLPARLRIGPVAFAEFSRATDLSTRGIIFYSVYGFGGFVLTAAVWYAAFRAKAPRFARSLLGAACICSVAVLVLTTRAAPLMWKIGSGSTEPVALAALLDRFTVWTALRVACVDASFLSVVAAMTGLVLASRTERAQADRRSKSSVTSRHVPS